MRLTREDLLDILYGAVIYGAGGGGDLKEGVGLIDDALAQGKTFDLIPVHEAPQDAWICTPYMLGAISDPTAAQAAAIARLPQSDEAPILTAYRRLESYLGQRFYGAAPCELGGSNTAVAMYAAAMTGGVTIDADPAGRAVPEITHSGYYLSNLPAAPISLANAFGETFLIENVVDDERAETIVRALSAVSANDIAAVDHALPLSQLRGSLVEGSLSMAMQMGRRWREALTEGEDVPQVVARHGAGRVVFSGRIENAIWSTENAFTLGEISLRSGAGDRYRIEVKNENLIGWLNDKAHVTIPEIITLFDVQTGQPITTPNASVDMIASVVVLPAPDIFTTQAGLAAFGPEYAGIDGPFVSALA